MLSGSSAADSVTVCGVFQLSAVKVSTLLGAGLDTVMWGSLLGPKLFSVMVTVVLLPAGRTLSRTV